MYLSALKFFGLSKKQVSNPNWLTVGLFSLFAFLGTRVESILLSVDVPAPVNSYVGNTLSLLLIAPFTFVVKSASDLIGFTTGLGPTALTLAALLLNISYWYLLAVYVQSLLFPSPKKK
ncbi:MAG TPA: hypothetical protein VJA40_06185 [archaeon]|nr:hypothetical protein [archaeon]